MSKRVLLRFFALMALISLVPIPSPAQQRRPPPPPPPQLFPEDVPENQESGSVELSANLVNITVVVRDPSGALVTDLNPADFVVYEDGVRQDVDEVFQQGEIPLKLALLFDASTSVRTRLDFEKRAASHFFSAALKPGDQAALFSVASDWKLEQPLTESPATLTQAMQRLEARGTTALFGAVQGASKYLGDIEGRRVLVALSDGYDTVQRETFAATLETAQKNDVVIYGISPAGSGQATSSSAVRGAGWLRQLCDQTGGVAFFPPVEVDREREAAALEAIYNQLIEELRAQYVLTYYTKSQGASGQFRTLRVEVKRPGLTVRARKGYYAK
jgi:Ca-activated chloride channel family protein